MSSANQMRPGEVTVNVVSLAFDRFIAKRHSISLQCLCTYFLFLIPLSRSVSPLLDISGTTLFRKCQLDHACDILNPLQRHTGQCIELVYRNSVPETAADLCKFYASSSTHHTLPIAPVVLRRMTALSFESLHEQHFK
ncbi:hypothetical protein QTP88_014285 [Uroleucon formosanum]